MARPKHLPPRDRVESWPATDLSALAPEVAVAVALAANLEKAMNGRSARSIGQTSGVDFTTINAIRNGSKWPEIATVARLEAALGVDLWPQGVARLSSMPK